MKQSTFFKAITVCVCGFGCAAPAAATMISGQGTWGTTLQARDLDGNKATIEAYYDTDLDITWLADANLAASNNFDVTLTRSDGKMTRSEATSWITAMNAFGGTGYLGINAWRLPSMMDIDSDGCGSETSTTINGEDCGYYVDTASAEMAHMFYLTLADLAAFTSTGVDRGSPYTGVGVECATCNSGPFSNLKGEPYWYGESYRSTQYRWYFNNHYGGQYASIDSKFYAWAVADGAIGTAVVPVPAALLLFGSGLLGLAGISRRTGTV